MAQKYQFSCTGCNKNFPVTQNQAGTRQDCPFCEVPNNLPGLREIRQLPTVNDVASHAQAKSNETKSWLFSGGLLVGIVAGLMGFALTGYANSLMTESTVAHDIEFGRAQLGELPAGHLWDAWDTMTKGGLPDWGETQTVRYNKQAGYLKFIAYGLYGLSAIGLLAIMTSFFVNRPQSR